MDSHSSESQYPANPISSALCDEILQELAGIAVNAANSQWDGLTTRLADALAEAVQTSANPKDAKLCASGASLLRKNRYPFYYVASERLATALHHEIQAAEYPNTAAAGAGAFRALAPELEVDKKLSLIQAGRAIEAEHNLRMTALNIRLASVLGREELSSMNNPFRPQVFLSVIHDAWCEFQPDTETHHLVYRLLGPDLCLDMAPILHALNSCLIKRGIVPHIAATDLPGQPAEVESGNDPLSQKLRQLFPAEADATVADAEPEVAGAFPSLFQEETVQATASRNVLLSFLSARQRAAAPLAPAETTPHAPQYESLGQLMRDAPAGALSQTDESVLELLAKIFDAILRDKHIANEMKVLIAPLQVPVFKLALQDKSFFFKEHHPARRVIELAARLAIGWDHHKGQSDPVYALIQRSVKAISKDADRHAGVFADVAAELDAFIKREDTASMQALTNPITSALHKEKLLEAGKAAKNEVALRVGTGEVVAFVETFLEDKWVSVLTLAYSVKDEKPQAVDSAVRTMDDLCWSVKPKITMLERKELLAKLPGMIAMLNKWLDTIKWNNQERAKFFTDLAACHASIVRAPLELSPERQMQIALSVAKKAAERRRQRQERQQPAPEPDEFTHLVERLERGTWIEFLRDDGGVLKVRLAWISPMRNMYLFATKERKEALSIASEALAQSFRVKRARVVSVSGLVGRVLASALGIESANTENLQAPAAA